MKFKIIKLSFEHVTLSQDFTLMQDSICSFLLTLNLKLDCTFKMSLVVGLDTEKSEETWLKHFKLLSKHEDEPPNIRNQPSVYALVSAVRCDQNFRHARQ
jgi:hypothetical protein